MILCYLDERKEKCIKLDPSQSQIGQFRLQNFVKSILHILGAMYGYIDMTYLTLNYESFQEPNSQIVASYAIVEVTV